MKKLYFTLYISFALIVLLSAHKANAQAYINFSKTAGSTGIDEVTDMKLVNGETYIHGIATAGNFPVTNGSTYSGGIDITLRKYSSNGTLLYSTYLGGLGNERVTSMAVVNGEVYLTGYTDSINYPVTNGSSFGGLRDIFVTKISTTGQIAFSTYIGGAGMDYPSFHALEVVGNEVMIAGNTGSPNFPVTGNSIYNGGISDGFVLKMDATTGAIISSEFVGGNDADYINGLLYSNGSVYLNGSTLSHDLPATTGSAPVNDVGENGFVVKIRSSDFSTSYLRYLAGNAPDFITNFVIDNDILHVTGYTESTDYPVTNGTTISDQPGDISDGFYTRLNSDGSIIFSTYLTTIDRDEINQILISNGDVYLLGSARVTFPAAGYMLIYKINADGGFAYSKKFNIGANNLITPSMGVINGELFLTGVSLSSIYPVTDGNQFYTGGTGFFSHLDPSGNIIFSGFLGKMNALLPMRIFNNKVFLLGNSPLLSYPATELGPFAGSNDNILIILNTDGTGFFGGYIGGVNNEVPTVINVDEDGVYLAGKTSSVDYPVTANILYNGGTDQFITKISFCPDKYKLTGDSIFPATQTVCKSGLAQTITGIEITVPADSLPVLYRNGIQSQQQSIRTAYQWQNAATPAGPWTNISTAVFKDYQPVLGNSNQYYRRLCYSLSECGRTLIHISDTAIALVNSLTAPVISGGGPFITCPGSTVTIGGSPTVSGGNPPYTSYLWDMGAAAIANPVVSPEVSTIYTLIVTDALGCRQIGQAAVLTYRADAGPDKGACGGIATLIGTHAIIGVPGISYNWQPGPGLNSTIIAQPFANPAVTTDYTLTLTIPKSGGGTCDTKDTVRVTPVAAPMNTVFAGEDQVLCLGDSIVIGTAPETGFNYTWSPGSFLTGNTSPTEFYYPGNIVMPVPNPAVLYVTAQKSGCSFSDETTLTTIEARAGLDGCGPRIIGLPDRTPNVDEIYTWTRISGSGNFTGPTNLPQVNVSASNGDTTVYRLTVTYNDHSCIDEVNVPSACIGCWSLIEVEASYLCPDFDINGGNVGLIAYSSVPDAIFTWTPQEGLSNYTGNVVHLTDNVPRTYTVTVTNAIDSFIRCTYSIFVNDPAFSKPVFPAPDAVTCIGVPVTIGLAPVEGYSYEWTGTGLSSNLSSDPVATVNTETAFPVKVSDGNGCELRDTVIVAVENVQANAGQDWIVCSNGVVKLGVPAQPNTTYLWQPEASPWQNGTNQFSAQPEVLVATDLTFIVTATSPAGCFTRDTVNVSISNIPVIPDASDTFVCIRNSVMIGSPALPGVTYQWTPAAGLSNPSIAQPLANPASTTTYTLLATFPGSCATSATDQVTVTIGNAFFNLPDISYCPDDGAIALGNGAPADMLSYSWQPALFVTNPSIPNPSTLNPPPHSTTLFTLTVTNADGCIYKDSITLTPLITSPVAGPDKLLCKGQSVAIGSAANVTGPAITYSWSPVNYLSDASSPNPIFTAVTGGIFMYVLTKTDITASCSSMDTVIIRVTDSLVPPLNPITVCENSCVQIGTSPSPGLQYQWSPVTGLSDPNISNPIACITNNTIIYSLSATDLNGCTISSNMIVTVNPVAAPQVIIPVINACLGDTNASFHPIVTPTGNYTYLWSPDNGTLSDIYSPTPQVAISSIGTLQYLLQVTDTITGCFNISTGNLITTICPTLSIIGDYMWFDTNTNGIQDAGELGVSGMTVRLYNDAGFNVASTSTDANGIYHFIDVEPGDNYYVRFSKPDGYDFTIRDVGGIGTGDNSEANDNGRSHNFNVPAGANITNIDAGIKPGCGTVPVTLLSFSANLHNTEVFLTWQTTAEYNNHYFDVERSNDSRNFSAIARVNGNGTTVLPHNYSLIDPEPIPGMNYYRLKQVDFDAHAAYSQIIPIRLNKTGAITAYYSNSSIEISFNEPPDKSTIKLYGANGQLIRSAGIAKNITHYSYEVPALARGVYMLQIRNDKLTWGKKIFIDR